MSDVTAFAALLTAVCVVVALGVLSSRVSDRLRVPAPALFLVVAAIASDLFPRLGEISIETVQRVATVALVLILFDGGMHIGWARFRAQAASIVWLGVAGTLVTAAAVAGLAHWLFGFAWLPSLLLGAALSPTDPAVVFSVLGRREIAGRSGVLLEGESGANDPVGIALVASIIVAAGVAGESGWTTFAHGLVEFLLQMGVGAAVGIVLGPALLWAMVRVALPSAGLYPLRTLAAAGIVYGVATIAHGSGFLAVFVAGIVIGDARAPYKREIEAFHSSLASLGEIVVFTVLGLTVSLRSLPEHNAWLIGLALAVLLAFVVRPLLVGLVLLPVRLRRNERMFVLWAGLKGAVPILLGTTVFTAGINPALELYDIIVVVVAFSVVVQGGLVPTVASWLRMPVRTVPPEPWTLGLRAREEPEGLHRFTVLAGSAAEGRLLDDLPLGEEAWVSLVFRGGGLVQVRGSTRLEAGDDVLVMVDGDAVEAVGALFSAAT